MKRYLLLILLAPIYLGCEGTDTVADGNKPTYTVNGSITTDNTAVNDADVQLISVERDTLFTKSDEKGDFEFESVPEGTYQFKAIKDRFAEFTQFNLAVEEEGVQVNAELKLLSFPDSLISSVKVINPDSLIGNYKLNINSSADFDMESDLGTDSSQLAGMIFSMSRDIQEGDVIKVTAIGDSKDIPSSTTDGRALVAVNVFDNLSDGPQSSDYEFLYFSDELETQGLRSPKSGKYIYIYAAGTGAVNWDGSFFKLYSVVGE